MSKKTNKKSAEVNPLIKTATDIVEKGVEHLLVLGVHGTGLMEIGTSLANYDQIHGLLNRALFEVNMAHTKNIRENVEKAVGEVKNEL